MMRWAGILSLLVVAAGCAQEVEPTPTEDASVPGTKEEAAQATQEGKADFSFDLCQRKGWYGDGACDWFCPMRDPDCDAAPLGPEPQGEATRFPIVLAHGFDASPTNRWGWFGVAEALAADGHEVYVATVPPYNSPEVRAGFLADEVDTALEFFGAEKVNIIAHSIGGLDGRFLISSMGYGDRIASLTTISSPHKGSAVADVGLKLVPGAAEAALNALARAWGRSFSDAGDEADLFAALEALAEANAPAFNAENPDDERVYYQSWAGVSSVLGLRNDKDRVACEGMMLENPKASADKMDATLIPMAAFVAHGTALLPNDGLSTVESARHGKFRGCFPADHLDEVGQVKDVGADPHTGFDHVRFYRNVAFELTALGF